jgi:CSLREA domain-containing protein
VLPAHALADTLRPTRFDDPPPGNCRKHDCSLREAVIAANDRPGKDVVSLGEGSYELTIPDADSGLEDIDPETGDLNLTHPGTVRGKGPRKTTVKAAFVTGGDRLFVGFTQGGKVTLSGMKITGGHPDAEPGGGVILAGPKARLANVVIADNSPLEGSGDSSGGGVYSLATDLEIIRSTIRDNLGTVGGGINVPAAIGTPHTTILSSTITGNAAYEGGGIEVDGSNTGFANPPLVEIINSTVAANHAEGDGGGVNSIAGGAVLMSHATVVDNRANNSDSPAGGNGGGVHVSSPATFRLDDSILAGNTVGSAGAHAQCSGTFPGGGNLLDGHNEGCNATYTFSSPAFLGPLQNNGGPTKTLALLSGSPALRLALSCPKRDQRGVIRPARCDSGAYERTFADP